MSKNKKAADSTVDKMFMAIAKYIEEAGGTAVVVGGISVEHRDKYKYTLRVDVLGKPPHKQN